ncbi:hypothetical protein L249_1836 [Ophiocordyceps polyrhachis-furcata BCC 54312]|uniref:TauD/TfdA-like domain-containing protein n=1 Tax=Ophiocordyceps polyrhachis-furcata BCC 54312 TaxID=1330021 RepID=A0A367LNX2_9HYPO|nr:hypothetical protein L249_1836 [Ophiocordyceps polyrhachis-furcata BCC 54312]
MSATQFTAPEAVEPGQLRPMTGPLDWSGQDFENEESYTYTFDFQDVEEIHNSLASFLSLRLDRRQVSSSNFPLPRLGRRLFQAAEAIHRGHGFVVFRGLDPSLHSTEENVIIYLGLASHVADRRGQQDKDGNVLSHITSSKLWDAPMEKRHGIHSNEALPFHTDMGCDILALHARQSAISGGCTFLSSAWKVFNHLIRQEPDTAATLLASDWPVQISGGKSHHYLGPVFAVHEGRLLVNMDPHRLGPPTTADEQEHDDESQDDIPALTDRQRRALEKVSEIAELTELQLELQSGDFLFLNNWALLHRRQAYRQDEDSPSRHLVRLWLRNSTLGWSIPDLMLPPWRAAFEEGSGVEMMYPLYPPDTYVVPRYTTGSAAFVIDDGVWSVLSTAGT